VYLSDRVLVLGEGRPAVILREVDVNLSRPRQRTHPAYIELCTALLRDMVYDVDREVKRGHTTNGQRKS
jgi:ABC-type nitrate/sulfonate/bicarbonate transport system ATPase subunit